MFSVSMFPTYCPLGRYRNFENGISEHIMDYAAEHIMSSCQRWMPRNNFGDRSTLVQAWAWCRQERRQDLSQCWHGVFRPNRVNSLRFESSYIVIELCETFIQHFNATFWYIHVAGVKTHHVQSWFNIQYFFPSLWVQSVTGNIHCVTV